MKRPGSISPSRLEAKKAPKLTNEATVACDRDATVSKLISWLEENKSNLKNVRVSKSDSGELGVFAVNDIASNKPIFTVGQACVMSADKIKKLSYGKFMLAAAAHSALPPPTDETLLILSIAAGKSDESFFFHPYINSLPETAPDPANWTEQERALLSGSTIHISLNDIFDEMADEFVEAIIAYAKENLDDEFQGLDTIFTEQALSMKQRLWARGMYVSRRFPLFLSDDKVEERESDVTTGSLGLMVPFLDLLNHKYGETIKWERLEDKAECVAFINTKNADSDSEAAHCLKAGDEVFNNYGYKSVEELFLSHGFCGTDMGHKDVVALRMGSLSVNPEVDSAKIGLLQDMEVPVVVRSNGSISAGPLYIESEEHPLIGQELLVAMAICGMTALPSDDEPLGVGLDELDALKEQLTRKLAALGDTKWTYAPGRTGRRAEAAKYISGQVRLICLAIAELDAILNEDEEDDDNNSHADT
eukprot:CFRG4269T1